MEENAIADATELSKRLIYPAHAIALGANTTAEPLEDSFQGVCNVIFIGNSFEPDTPDAVQVARYLRRYVKEPALYYSTEAFAQDSLYSRGDLEAEEEVAVRPRRAFGTIPIPQVQRPIRIPFDMISLLPDRSPSISLNIQIPEDFEE